MNTYGSPKYAVIYLEDIVYPGGYKVNLDGCPFAQQIFGSATGSRPYVTSVIVREWSKGGWGEVLHEIQRNYRLSADGARVSILDCLFDTGLGGA